jgi:hypothetical protein
MRWRPGDHLRRGGRIADAIGSSGSARREGGGARTDPRRDRLLDRVRPRPAGRGSPDTAVDGNSALLAATGENCADTVAFLLDRGADVNAKNSDGWTPLIKAASANFPEVARVLLKHGADPDIADTLDRTAWMYASMNGREEIAALLKEVKRQK